MPSGPDDGVVVRVPPLLYRRPPPDAVLAVYSSIHALEIRPNCILVRSDVPSQMLIKNGMIVSPSATVRGHLLSTVARHAGVLYRIAIP